MGTRSHAAGSVVALNDGSNRGRDDLEAITVSALTAAVVGRIGVGVGVYIMAQSDALTGAADLPRALPARELTWKEGAEGHTCTDTHTGSGRVQPTAYMHA